MNLDKTYTVKSNAMRDMRKAIAKGALPSGCEVVVVPAGYQIVLPTAPAAPAKAVITPPEVTAIQAAREAEAATPAAAPQAAPAPQAGKIDYGLALTSALATSRVWPTKGLALSDRAGVWVLFEAVHDAQVPHGLTKGQMPGCTGGARKRGLIQIAMSNEVGIAGPRKVAICLTPAGLAAHRELLGEP